MKKHLGLLIAAIAILVAVGACSTDDKDADSGNGGGKDSGTPIADLNMNDDATAACGEGVYPCGVYGTRKGEVIENELFLGFSDPDVFCKAAQNRQLDLGKKVNMEFGSWYRKPDGCEKKKLLWVMVSAGWCGPCVQEIKEVMGQINQGALQPELDLVDILFEDDNAGPVTEAFARNKWAPTTGLNFTLLLDPEFKMGKYFDRESVPFNMLVDLETMKVVYSQTGSNMSAMGEQIQAFFKN